EGVVFKFSNAICESLNKSWVVVNKCRLLALSRDRNTFNMNLTMLHPAYDIFVNCQVFKRANGYKPWLFNVTVDACRFTKRPYNPFIILIYNLFKEFSNINHTCPYVGHQIIQGFFLRPEVLRLPIPTGDYLLEMTWMLHKKPQMTTNLYFIFIEDILKK
ncbi:hypothetical protein KR044_001510, partial [Drosophila immigrans]